MSHEITMTANGAAEAAFATPAWHGLGKVFDRAFTSAEAIDAAGLGWTVGKRPLFADIDGAMVDVETHCQTYRTDNGNPLGVVGAEYGILQNSAAFEAFDGLVPDGLLRYESAFSLRGGRTICAVARLGESMDIADGDLIAPYALLTNSHDGSGAVNIYPTTVRVVCANTLRMANAQARTRIKVRHTKNVEDRTRDAVDVLGRIIHLFEEFGTKARRLIERQMQEHEFAAYLDDVMPLPKATTDSGRASPKFNRTEKARAQVTTNFYDDPKQNLPGIERTAWAALNAVTQYVDHEADMGRGDDAESHFRVVTFDAGAKLKDHAFSTALELVGA